MEIATKMLAVQGCEEVKPYPNGDWLIEWLRSQKCGAIANGLADQLSSKDVKEIRDCLNLPLLPAEKIFLCDLMEKENGLLIKRVGIPERLAKLGLIRNDNPRLKATKYLFDPRIQYILGI